MAEKAAAADLFDAIQRGILDVGPSRTYGLDDIVTAHRDLEAAGSPVPASSFRERGPPELGCSCGRAARSLEVVHNELAKLTASSS